MNFNVKGILTNGTMEIIDSNLSKKFMEHIKQLVILFKQHIKIIDSESLQNIHIILHILKKELFILQNYKVRLMKIIVN